MRPRQLGFGILTFAAWLTAASYFLFLLPALFFGLAAYSDYQDLGCPGAEQCSDAALMMKIVLFYILAAPVIWLLLKAMRKIASSWGGEAHA